MVASRELSPSASGAARGETEPSAAIALARQNANYDRHNELAKALRAAWRSGDKSWLDLAGIALAMLEPGSAKADAVFVIELHADGRSSLATHAPWGGEPSALLSRAAAAIQAEADDLGKCPAHAGPIDA